MRSLLHSIMILPLLASALVLASPLRAQAVPPGAIAWTQCLDGKVETFINAEALGGDSTVVILRHEEVHRRQQRDSVTSRGACWYPTTAYQLLNWEIEAYCASDSTWVNIVKRDSVETSAQTLLRLVRQFSRAMPVFTIADSWAKGCPGSTNKKGIQPHE